MSNPAAEFFTTPIKFAETIKSQAKPISAVASAPSSTSGPSIGKVIVFGIAGVAGVVVFWQLAEWYKRMEKILDQDKKRINAIIRENQEIMDR